MCCRSARIEIGAFEAFPGTSLAARQAFIALQTRLDQHRGPATIGRFKHTFTLRLLHDTQPFRDFLCGLFTALHR